MPVWRISALYDVELVAGDSLNDPRERGIVPNHPGFGIVDCLLVFSKIARDMDSSQVTIVVDATVGDGLTEGRYDRGLRGGSLNVFQEVPLAKFVVRLYFPLAVVIVVPIVDDFGKLRLVHSVAVGHDSLKLPDTRGMCKLEVVFDKLKVVVDKEFMVLHHYAYAGPITCRTYTS